MTAAKEERCLVMFVRFPEPGGVKSRLAAKLGGEEASNLYRSFVEDLLERLSGGPYRFRIAFHPADRERELRKMLGGEFSCFAQEGEDLGERMKNSFLRCYEEGARCVALIGSDIPDLPKETIDEAFCVLGKKDAVIGPAEDGGYYLIGFRQESFNSDVFGGISWGTDAVFRETVETLEGAGAHVHVLTLRRDIDRPEDIAALIEDSKGTAFAASRTMTYLRAIGLADLLPKFSFIIPVFNEEAIIIKTIEHVRGLLESGGTEIIVVDGNPAGNTIKAISDMGVRTVISDKGRGTQMNLGASLATGEILVFLHADTSLPTDALRLIAVSLEDASLTAGAFDLAIDSERPAFRIIEKAASARSRLTRIPYGDQAIFMRRKDFQELGGFRDIPIMEDVEIMRRIKRRRGKILILRRPVKTSARRWEME
ncbi:MAG TPA: TIGR04283 family arsenosugar biosynthesis glycosyltransferase, partial [Syntrophales bacterium]|nr:TIGR04283 family arsenosugar biosynthesis glycosyltransferase [Syntrophales bacterium]